jgi:transposase
MTFEVEQLIRRWVKAQPGITLAGLQYKLERDFQIHVSIGRLWQVLRQMGLRPEKVRSAPAKATPATSGGFKKVVPAHPVQPR